MIDEKLTIPIYQQIANEIEDMILNGELKEESQAPSMNQLADHYKINPATARKGLELLTNENILYKKRGTIAIVDFHLLLQQPLQIFAALYALAKFTQHKK